MKDFLRNHISFILKQNIYKLNSTVTIRFGPLKGYRYTITDNSGWAPIYGGWEPEAQKLYSTLISVGETVYDLGANTGIHSLLFSKLVGSNGKVFAFEPLQENLLEIESLKQLNLVTNIYLIDQAIGDKSGNFSFKVGRHNKQGSLIGIGCEAGSTVTVVVTTLDCLIDGGLALPDLIKVDIEGSEGDALDGFSKSIVKSYPSFAIDLHTPQQDVRVGEFLKGYGYQVYRLKNSTATKITGQQKTLARISRLDLGWPDPGGMWGTVIAVHPSRQHVVARVEKLL